jgi:integrase
MGMFPRFRAPETMTTAEQAALLTATAAHDAPRDHVLYSMALGTGLRLNELLGLNVGDVTADGRAVRRRIVLRQATTKGGRRGEVFLPERLIPKLARYLSWKRDNGQAMDGPLFVSGQHRRLSPRAAQWLFAWWQARAGFDRRYNFHCFRHYAESRIMPRRHCNAPWVFGAAA